MLIVLSGPQAQYKKVQGALTSASFTIVTTDHGDPVPYTWGFSPSTETRWNGSLYSASDIKELDDNEPEHGHKVGDVVRGTGHIESVESKAPTQFLTVEGDEARVSDAQAVVAEFGWVLRAHFDKPEPPKPLSLDEKLNRLGLTRAELQTVMGN